jgi:hypothetical protein
MSRYHRRRRAACAPKPARRAASRLSFQSLEVRRVLHHEGGNEDANLVINNFAFEKGPDFADSSQLVSGAQSYSALAALPVLNSHLGAPATVYLNFLGDFTPAWGRHANITTPVFDLDGDATTFSSSELVAIERIFERVSEDFAPFDVNITTVDPGQYLDTVAMKVNIGGAGGWLGTPAGGVAYIDNWISPIPNVVFVFPGSLGNNEKNIAEASSHETGHAFGLQHQSTFDAAGIKLKEYNPGGGGWAPIMGNSYSQALSTWSNGPSSLGANILQDDMAVIARASNGFGYRADDHAGAVGSGDALAIDGNAVSAAGVIETMSDVDAFSFVTDAGAISLSANVIDIGANLDAVLELRDAGGTLVAMADPTDALGASISLTVPAGNYTLLVRSTGVYGRVGQYTVSGTINTGMFVSAHTPSASDVVSAPPLDFTLELSEAFDAAGVDAADLLVNGIPADGFSIVDGQTVVFHYNVSPVVNEGLQTLAMAAGAMARGSDGNPSKPFAGTFRYDPARLAVDAISPSAAAHAQTPLTSIVLHFSEAVEVGSLAAADLLLDRGAVTGMSIVDSQTVLFTVSGLVDEGPLTVTLPAGAVTDMAGNPNLAYATTLTLDYGTIAYPAPLASVAPQGGLIFDPAITGAIAVAADSDSFTIELPAGQTVTTVLAITAGLQGRVQWFDANSALVGSAHSAAAGMSVTLGPLPTGLGGAYTIVVDGLAGTTGDYQLELLLNAAAEGESHDGPNNDLTITAQDIDASFIDLGGGIERGAVIGRSDPPTSYLPAEIETNDTQLTANNAANNFMIAAGGYYQLALQGAVGAAGDQDWYAIGALDAGDKLTITSSGSPSSRGTLSDAIVDLWRANSGSPVQVATNDDGGTGDDSLINAFTIAAADTYYIRARAFSTRVGTYQVGVWLENSGATPLTSNSFVVETEANGSAATANDATSAWRAAQYASSTTASAGAGDNDYYRFQFTAGDVVTLQAKATGGAADLALALFNSAGTQIAAEGGDSTGAGADSNLYAFVVPATGSYFARVRPTAGTGTYTLNAWLATINPPGPVTAGGDDFAFTADAGQFISVALADSSAGSLTVELLDSLGATVATGAPGANAQSLLSAQALSAGTYYLRVTGDQNLDYSLVVVRGGAFEAEPNQPASASLDGAQGAIGHLDANPPSTIGDLNFTVDTAQSAITISGAFSALNLPITEQTPGSGTTQLQGTLIVNRQIDHLSFPGGSAISAVDQPGPFLPGNVSADYGMQVVLSPETSAYAVLQNVAVDMNSVLLAPLVSAAEAALAAGDPINIEFPANSVLLTLVSGTASYDLTGLSGSQGLAGLSLANGSQSAGTLVEADGVLTLNLPIDVTTTFTVPTANIPITLHFFGQMVASYVLPGPIDQTDEFTVTLGEGDTLTLATATPLDGAAAAILPNALDPRLAIYTPLGELAASDDNSAADGKNAALAFTAPAAGVYRIAVAAAGGNGEYVLQLAVNHPPVPNGGGPYTIVAGSPLHLDATGSSDPDPGDTLTYSWDINGDNIFGDATGAGPTVSWSTLQTLGIAPGGVYNTSVRVTDSKGVSRDAVTGLTVDPAAPQVVGLWVKSGGSLGREYAIPVGSGDQLRSAALGQVQAIKIQFSEGVAIDVADLKLEGVSVANYAPSGFTYDNVNHIATWTFDAPIDADQLVLTLTSSAITDSVGGRLDGEWINPITPGATGTSVFPSGNGVEGGDFVFWFNVLPGDINGSGTVDGGDYTIWADNFGQHAGSATYAQGDLNDDGLVNGVDYTIWADHFVPQAAAAAQPVVSTAMLAHSAIASVPAAALPVARFAPAALSALASHAATVPQPRYSRGDVAKLAFASAVDALFARPDSGASLTRRWW